MSKSAFDIQYHEFDGNEDEFSVEGLGIKAFKVKHNVLCYGYTMSLARAGRFDVERANEANIPQKFWGRLQKGETIEHGGSTYTPDMVMGADRQGLKVTYCTDTRPGTHLVECAKGSDLLICEGMYAEPEKLEKAKQYKHMTFYEAAEVAKKAEVDELWLTHFSPSLVNPKQYMPQVRKIFENSHLGKDGKHVELKFRE